MIKKTVRSTLGLLLIFILASSVLCFSTGCDRFILLRVENHSNDRVTVFVNNDLQGSVPAKSKQTFNTASIPNRPDVPWAPASGKYLIEAKTPGGKVIYSNEFTWHELDDIDWKIIIPPL